MGGTNKRLLTARVKELDFWQAYRVCRRVGERPWCSLRIAVVSRWVISDPVEDHANRPNAL